MTRQELAEVIGISRNTLNTWEKEKPELIKLINLGLHAEEIILENDRLNKKLKKTFIKLQTNKLQLPKSKLNKEEYLNYRNPTDFDTGRVQRICHFLGSTHVINFRTVVLRALKEIELDDSGTYRYIEKQTSKQNLLREFSKFIREMVSENDIVEAQGTKIIQFVNKNLKMDFNKKDIDVIDHIVIMYDYYSELFGIEDEKEEF